MLKTFFSDNVPAFPGITYIFSISLLDLEIIHDIACSLPPDPNIKIFSPISVFKHSCMRKAHRQFMLISNFNYFFIIYGATWLNNC